MNLEDALEAVDHWLEEDGPGGWLEDALNAVHEAAWQYSELTK